MSDTEVKEDTRLFMDLQGGRVVCFKHLGGYGRADVEAYPQGTGREPDGRPTWRTPLDVWMVLIEEDFKAWATMSDTPPSCEDCRFEVKP